MRSGRPHRLAVVTNTHHPTLVPDHLDAMGLSPHIDAVITSVEVGWRKPHPAIYEAVLGAMQCDELEVRGKGVPIRCPGAAPEPREAGTNPTLS